MMKMREAFRKLSMPANLRRKFSLTPNNDVDDIRIEDFERLESQHKAMPTSLEGKTLSLEELAKNDFDQRTKGISYNDIITIRKNSMKRRKSENIIDVLGLHSIGAELTSQVSSNLQTVRYQQSANQKQNKYSKMQNIHVKLPSRRTSIQEILSVKPSKTKRKNLQTKSFEAQEILERAITEGYLEFVKKLIETEQVNINKLNGTGYSALHLAAIVNNPEIIKLLLENGAFININDLSGFTPLEVAVNEGSFDSACVLIEHGADQTFIMDGRLDTKMLQQSQDASNEN